MIIVIIVMYPSNERRAIMNKAYALTGETPEPFPKDYNQNVTIHW